MTRPLTDRTVPADSEADSEADTPKEIRTVKRLRQLRDRVTSQMGGPEAVGAIYAAGRRTAAPSWWETPAPS